MVVFDPKLSNGSVELLVNKRHAVLLASLVHLCNTPDIQRNFELVAEASKSLHAQITQVLLQTIEIALLIFNVEKLASVPVENF